MMGNTVFISWSGERSRYVAEALWDWLPLVLQIVEPWMSAEDVEKGSPWESEIMGKLDEANVGIVCLTPENRFSTQCDPDVVKFVEGLDHDWKEWHGTHTESD
jgi:hypothetical protein